MPCFLVLGNPPFHILDRLIQRKPAELRTG